MAEAAAPPLAAPPAAAAAPSPPAAAGIELSAAQKAMLQSAVTFLQNPQVRKVCASFAAAATAAATLSWDPGPALAQNAPPPPPPAAAAAFPCQSRQRGRRCTH